MCVGRNQEADTKVGGAIRASFALGEGLRGVNSTPCGADERRIIAARPGRRPLQPSA